MGLTISGLLHKLLNKRRTKILMLGLDGAGKTTILYHLKLSEVVTTTPTIGFNVEAVEYNGISFTVWDVGGQDKIRQLWRFYFESVDGLIFVVDCNDTKRIEEASVELMSLLGEEKLSKAVLLIFANKQDLPNSVTCYELIEKLGISRISQRPWHVQPSIASLGHGVYDGLDWLSNQLSKL